MCRDLSKPLRHFCRKRDGTGVTCDMHIQLCMFVICTYNFVLFLCMYCSVVHMYRCTCMLHVHSYVIVM